MCDQSDSGDSGGGEGGGFSRPGSSGSSSGAGGGTAGSSKPGSATSRASSERGGGLDSVRTCPQDLEHHGVVAHSRQSSSSSGDGLLLSVSALTLRNKRESSEEDRGDVGGGTAAVARARGNPLPGPCDVNDQSLGSDHSCGCEAESRAASEEARSGGCMGQRAGHHAQLPYNTTNTVMDISQMKRLDPEGLNETDCQNNSAGFSSFLAVDKRVFGRLQEELTTAQSELKLKEEEVTRLSRIRVDIEAELEELTASLFQEAHKMVADANLKRIHAEKLLAESDMKVDGLQTEVAALKALVITSTPARPNLHLHPQIDPSRGGSVDRRKVTGLSPGGGGGGGGGGSSSTPGSPMKEARGGGCVGGEEKKLIDPVLRGEYLQWKKSPSMDTSLPFLQRIYREDIDLCLDFPNRDLSAKVKDAVHQNSLCISPVKEDEELPRNCELLEQPRLCSHRLLLGEGDPNHHHISPLARNRIAAVCDFLTYCRYVTQGLVKSHCNDVYWEIINLRKNMTLSRLGYTL